MLLLLNAFPKRFWTIVLGAVFLLACGDSSVYQTYSAPIVFGEADQSQDHMAVVMITVANSLCTGTLITQDVVLTAGHCVDSEQLQDYSVIFTKTTQPNARVTIGVSERLRHPDYDREMVLNDIALLRLESNAPDDITPIPFLPRHLALGRPDLGKPIEFVGFGVTETGIHSFGTKMRLVGQVDRICTDLLGCNFSNGFYGVNNTICYEQQSGGPCSGDSGGPALFVAADGQTYVGGVTSYGLYEQADNYLDQCLQFGCSTKVDAFEEFIVDFVGAGLASACNQDADCNVGVCVEGVCCTSRCDQACRSCSVAGHEGYCTTVENGTPCSDHNVCNGEEVCILGSCAPGQQPPLECHDQDPCTTDLCDPKQGCIFVPTCSDQGCSVGNTELGDLSLGFFVMLLGLLAFLRGRPAHKAS